MSTTIHEAKMQEEWAAWQQKTADHTKQVLDYLDEAELMLTQRIEIAAGVLKELMCEAASDWSSARRFVRESGLEGPIVDWNQQEPIQTPQGVPQATSPDREDVLY